MRKYNGKSNVSGKVIEQYRVQADMSRDDLARELQLRGISMDRTHILRVEKEEVILKDFELLVFCNILKIKLEDLLKNL